MGKKRQIIALGGGGFSDDPLRPDLDKYILQQARKETPKICFLGTATGDSKSYIDKFHTFFSSLQCETSHLSLFRLPTQKLRSYIFEQDIVYVGGGNTRSMLALWREWKLDSVLSEAYQDGILLAGTSAGAMCWFEHGLADSTSEGFEVIKGIGLIPGINCVHYNSSIQSQKVFEKTMLRGPFTSGLAIDDWVAVHYVDEKILRVITTQQDASAYQFSVTDSQIRKEALPNHVLNDA
jgi:peptidase E